MGSKLAKKISEICGKESRLLYYLPHEIQKSLDEDRAIVIEENNELAGFAIWDFYGDKWCEIHSLYVNPAYRSRGYSQRLVEETKNRLVNFRGNVFFFTVSPIVAQLAQEFGFAEKRLFALPANVLFRIILHRLHPARLPSYIRKLRIISPISRVFVLR